MLVVPVVVFVLVVLVVLFVWIAGVVVVEVVVVVVLFVFVLVVVMFVLATATQPAMATMSIVREIRAFWSHHVRANSGRAQRYIGPLTLKNVVTFYYNCCHF